MRFKIPNPKFSLTILLHAIALGSISILSRLLTSTSRAIKIQVYEIASFKWRAITPKQPHIAPSVLVPELSLITPYYSTKNDCSTLSTTNDDQQPSYNQDSTQKTSDHANSSNLSAQRIQAYLADSNNPVPYTSLSGQQETGNSSSKFNNTTAHSSAVQAELRRFDEAFNGHR
ncbi:hypothetical protein ACMFMF_000321 [Clarireedia jacksonii]